ncbi:AroM family protein [Calorimonas adulescens]|jgi:AroM protein.|uniref:AroM family protein n=1 Tax=Calorimonas adulescens TaxID=2606906 RepID=A0A5D8QCB8_9THEO|nr:AroM family protein [Calorimonas adulescens]TZE82290.1 AroM family protein [Calorimonas adulescens]
MNKRIGAVTIGQSPRTDIISEIKCILGDIEIIERGALDDLSRGEIEKLTPVKGVGKMLVSRLRDGTEVKLSEDKILGLMQQKIDELNGLGVDAILLLCTGEFPHFDSHALLIKPGDVIKGIVDSLDRSVCLGVMVPDKGQIEMTLNKWSGFDNIVIAAASPYGVFDGIVKAAGKLNLCDIIVMDCMGYNLQMKEAVKKQSGRPVILSRTTVARVAAEILN